MPGKFRQSRIVIPLISSMLGLAQFRDIKGIISHDLVLRDLAAAVVLPSMATHSRDAEVPREAVARPSTTQRSGEVIQTEGVRCPPPWRHIARPSTTSSIASRRGAVGAQDGVEM
jgi:hypothetical protein